MIHRRLTAAALAALLTPAVVSAQIVKRTPGSEARVVALSRGLYRLTALGDTALLSARIFGENFKPLAGVPLEWSSEDDAIATATASGAVIAMKNGTTRIWAKAGTDSVFAVVTVEQRAAKLGWNVANPLIFDAIGASAQLRAEQRDTRGNVVRGDFPLTACTIKDDGGRGTVSISGARLLAKANGAATLACRRGLVRDDLKIVVQQAIFAAKVLGGDTVSLAVAGDTTRLAVQAFDRLGKPISDARGAWTSLTPEIVEVESTGGTILGKAEGVGMITARFDNAVDTVVVNVLGPLPAGRTMPVLARARPVVVQSATVQATPAAGGGVPVGGVVSVVGGAAPAPAPLPSAPVLPPAGSSNRPIAGTYIAPRGQVATFASTGAGAGSAAADSAAIAQIIDAGLRAGKAKGRTWVITPTVAQAEYRTFGDTLGTVWATGGLLYGLSGRVEIGRGFFLDGNFLTGDLKATSGTVTNIFDGAFSDTRGDLGYEPIDGFVLRVGYGARFVGRKLYSNLEKWSMVRTGLDGKFNLFGDRVTLNIGATYFPSVSAKGQQVDMAGVDITPSISTMLGANAGVRWRVSWFTVGVDYTAQSIEFNKVALLSRAQRQDRLSVLRLIFGGHWGK